MCVMAMGCFVNTIVTALSLCAHIKTLKCNQSLPFYLEILSLELSFPEGRASSGGDTVVANPGGAMKETTEIQAQLLHYTIVFSRTDAALEQ